MTDSPTSSAPSDRAKPWAPFSPTDEVPWDLRRVVHLHRRAGFAACRDEVERDLKEGPDASLTRLLEGRERSGQPQDDFESTSTVLADAAAGSGEPNRLKAWWIWRMQHTPDPLGERLTLWWHNSFATGNQKVRDLAAMRLQNETFRRLARAPFGELLNAAVRDPALLAWLDAPANRKGHANENLARELLELFTVGIGHYIEADVQEAARALTGWSVRDGGFREVPATHDEGVKSIFGKRGNWSGKDLIAIVLDHPATAERLARRICELFMGERLVNADELRGLAEGLRANNLDVGWAVKTVLRSQAFFEDSNIASRVAGPPEFVVGALSALEIRDARTIVLADWLSRLGQDLFYPPNVGGWPGGRGWLGSRGLIARVNFAAVLADGQAIGCAEPLDAVGLAGRHGCGQNPEELLDWFSRLLLGRELCAPVRDRILAAAKPLPLPDLGRRLVELILTTPEAQLS
jgi:uncharacterized protein (DUF1800 family)